MAHPRIRSLPILFAGPRRSLEFEISATLSPEANRSDKVRSPFYANRMPSGRGFFRENARRHHEPPSPIRTLVLNRRFNQSICSVWSRGKPILTKNGVQSFLE